MGPAIRYSASDTSRITKKLLSPTKKKNGLILPSEAKYLQTIKTAKENRKSNLKQADRLDKTTSVELQYRFEQGDDMMMAVEITLANQWDQLPVKGISLKMKSEINSFRSNIPRIISINQLYSIFPRIPTYVDREVEKLVQKKILRRVYVNNNENDILIKCSDYRNFITSKISSSNVTENERNTLSKLHEFTQNDTVMYLSRNHISEQNFTKEQITSLINLGFLTILQDNGEITNYAITLPSIGLYLKITLSARNWVLKTLKRQTWKELLESQLQERWENNKFKFKEFKGYSLTWVLCEAIGSGDVEVFGTPAGRGWKLIT